MRGRSLAILGVLALLPACGDGSDDDDAGSPAAAAGGGEIRFSAATYAVDESAGTVVLTVQRGGSAEASVRFQTERGTASEEDFEEMPSTEIAWAAGDPAPKTVSIAIRQDAAVEGVESFFVHLGSSRGAPLGPMSVARVDIGDDESAAAGVFQFSSAAYGAAEGTQVTISVLRSGGNAGSAAVEVDVEHGTAGADDYQVVGGGFPMLLSWADGEGGAKSFNIELRRDGDPEGDQAFRVELGDPTPGSFAGSPSSASVDILDGDLPGTIRFAESSYEAIESGGPRAITLRRRGGVQGPASASIVVDGGTADPGADYTFAPSVVSWADGEAGDRTVVITPVADASPEGSETTVFRLDAVQGAAPGAPSSTLLTIHD